MAHRTAVAVDRGQFPLRLRGDVSRVRGGRGGDVSLVARGVLRVHGHVQQLVQPVQPGDRDGEETVTRLKEEEEKGGKKHLNINFTGVPIKGASPEWKCR